MLTACVRRNLTRHAAVPLLSGTTRRAQSTSALVTGVAVNPAAVHLTWSDGSESRFHHAWLRDHCPQSVHPVSHQRELPLRHVSGAAPTRVDINGNHIQVAWPAANEASGKEHVSTFAAEWLFEHRYDVRVGARTASSIKVVTSRADKVIPWLPEEMAGGNVPNVAWESLVASSAVANETALTALRHLRRSGILRVRGVPPTVEATEALATQLGMVQPTMYGYIWDTAPRNLEDVIDTAYTNVELPLHTDCCYLEAQPGIQLFNCVEQPPPSPGEPHGGSTKLADGFMAAEVLRRDFPATFAYFCRVSIPFHHVEGERHLVHTAPVFKLHPVTAEVVGFRYNDTDRAPLCSLGFEDVPDFYAHARVLETTLEALQVPLRLECGDTILIDNHRVLHGRYAFQGRRNLIGCYMTADDWRSKLRVLETAARAKQRQPDPPSLDSVPRSLGDHLEHEARGVCN